jgi:predicted nucleic acid-binding protein
MTVHSHKPHDLILDCSVTMAWCFEDEVTEYSENVFENLNTIKAYVPTIWSLEIANVILFAERKGRLNRAKATAFIESIRGLPIIQDDNSPFAMSTTFEIARESDLTIYDASYLELALRLGLPLATLDKNLRKAAQKNDVTLY